MDFDDSVWPARKKVQNLTDFGSNVGAKEADSLTKMFFSLVFYLYYSSYLTVLSIIGPNIISINKIPTERMFSYLINLKFLDSYLLTSS